MTTVAIVQARLGSLRFPDKVMRLICGKPMIALLLARLSKARKVDKIIVAIPKNKRDDPLAALVENLGFTLYRGNEEDVLDRYYQAAKQASATTVVRITGDCPLIDFNLVDQIIEHFHQCGVDYAANTIPPTYPDGLDTEVFTFKALETAWKNAKEPAQREHVTPYIKNNSQFTRLNYANDIDCSNERWTVDEAEDFALINHIFECFYPNLEFGWDTILKLRDTHPNWFNLNKHLIRDEGASLGKGQKLWRRAKKIIPGGNMLLSKRAEMFLPEKWPAYFSRAKGCRVWDLDDNEYIDMSIMGIGTNVLGYGHPEVDAAVREVVNLGNMSTFNCPEEVYLAERLIKLHPWSSMVRLARTGGEANAIAIRIARCASRRDKVAICGYHGWHDWYLAANLGDEENLNTHLLPGLEPNGVPKNLSGSVLPFQYNDYVALERLIKQHDVGVIKMEVSRNSEPKDDFLQKIRKLATEKDIILIFDECTSGFRQTFGGLHKHYGVNPDMAIFSKTLGNGYAISAVIGRKDIMEAAQNTFISSTFWTERIGPSAALKTLEVMERERSWEKITNTGQTIGQGWLKLANKYGLPLEISGLAAMIGFQIPVANKLKYKTLITQEMMKKGILATNSVYVCIDHAPSIVEQYFAELEPIFSLIKACETGDLLIDNLLEGPVCHEGFKRLN
ncbi:MAG: aminotransferase class III-fold pyridoxal phosphate-dependent enzyme [Gammaproteobacteria bacterium]|nr:aminotransferase class III-fold pyridoxal phosphate-dependent enzyme [Gammaproteobacteria bacterium]